MNSRWWIIDTGNPRAAGRGIVEIHSPSVDVIDGNIVNPMSHLDTPRSPHYAAGDGDTPYRKPWSPISRLKMSYRFIITVVSRRRLQCQFLTDAYYLELPGASGSRTHEVVAYACVVE